MPLDYRTPPLVGIPAASFEKMEADGIDGKLVRQTFAWREGGWKNGPFTVKMEWRRPLELAFDGVAGIPEQWDCLSCGRTAARSVNLRYLASYTYTQAIGHARFLVVSAAGRGEAGT